MNINLHLISDSTGGTLDGIIKATMAQFANVEYKEHLWNLIRTKRQIDIIIKTINEHKGPVFFTMVDDGLASYLQNECKKIGVPCIAVLQPVMNSLTEYLNLPSQSKPGLQHKLNDDYFDRIDAMDYALHHDDGQISGRSLAEADVILLGVSRTSKTPTCIYLANRGIKAANVPLIPDIEPPKEIFKLTKPLFVGLTECPKRLVDIRSNRLEQLGQNYKTDYLELEKVKEEVKQARQLFTKMNWPVIDVTNRSVEETSAEILSLLSRRAEIN